MSDKQKNDYEQVPLYLKYITEINFTISILTILYLLVLSVGIILNLIPVVETLLGYLCNQVSIIPFIDLLDYFHQTQNLGGNYYNYNDSNFSFNKVEIYYNKGTDIDVVTPYSEEVVQPFNVYSRDTPSD